LTESACLGKGVSTRNVSLDGENTKSDGKKHTPWIQQT